jgi:hypothetical protein
VCVDCTRRRLPITRFPNPTFHLSGDHHYLALVTTLVVTLREVAARISAARDVAANRVEPAPQGTTALQVVVVARLAVVAAKDVDVGGSVLRSLHGRSSEDNGGGHSGKGEGDELHDDRSGFVCSEFWCCVCGCKRIWDVCVRVERRVAVSVDEKRLEMGGGG